MFVLNKVSTVLYSTMTMMANSRSRVEPRKFPLPYSTIQDNIGWLSLKHASIVDVMSFQCWDHSENSSVAKIDMKDCPALKLCCI